jgi:ABC-type transport system involved in multi-copper enzyme maturation permease subunit
MKSSASSNSYFQNQEASSVMSFIVVIMTIWISTITNDLELHKVRNTMRSAQQALCRVVINSEYAKQQSSDLSYHKILRADWTLMWLVFFQPKPYNIMLILYKLSRWEKVRKDSSLHNWFTPAT